MLAVAGLVTIVVLLAAILSQRVSALAALIAVPVAAALAIGAGRRRLDLRVAGPDWSIALVL